MTTEARGLTKGEKGLLRHMRKPWWNVINKKSFHVFFGTESGRSWCPKGPTGAIVASLMRKELIDFAPNPGRIGKIVRIQREGKCDY